MTHINIFRAVLPSLVLLFAVWFGTSVQAATQPGTPELPAAGVAEAEAGNMLPDFMQNLLSFALDQAGIRYRKGGADPASGFDCSGLVRYVFEHAEGVVLPHSALAISRLGEPVDLAELQPGDLVFFRIFRRSVSHVGIYIGNQLFIHSSGVRTGGVRISRLTDRYWTRHFRLARRLALPGEQGGAVCNCKGDGMGTIQNLAG